MSCKDVTCEFHDSLLWVLYPPAALKLAAFKKNFLDFSDIRRTNTSATKTNSWKSNFSELISPAATWTQRYTLNVHKTFKRRPGRFFNALYKVGTKEYDGI